MREPLDAGPLAALTAEIVAAYVAHHPVAVAGVPALTDAVAQRLARLAPEEGAAAQALARREPAVPVRRSVTPERLTCLACGRRVSTLKRHLQTAYSLTSAGYREAFGLKGDYPMVAPAQHAARRAEVARRGGLGWARGAPTLAPARLHIERSARLRLPGATAPAATTEGGRRP